MRRAHVRWHAPRHPRHGLELDVPPHGEYEAWELSFTDGRKVVCMPGGW
ncbi:DUF6188 family protein [Streptomyces subrutilus]